MLFLHPKRDKSKEHITKIVQNVAERDDAMAQGYFRQNPHIPIIAISSIPAGFEAGR